MATENIAVITLKLDVDDYTKEAIRLNKEIKSLTDQQKQLKSSGQDTGLEFQRNVEILTGLKNELRETNKTIQDVTKANNSQAGSNEELRASLSVMTLQYNKLSAEERESSSNGKELQATIKSVSDTLKANEGAVGDNRRSVGDYKNAIILANKEIANLKDQQTKVGFVITGTMAKIDSGSQSLKAMSDAGLSGTTAFVKLDNEVKGLNVTLQEQEVSFLNTTEQIYKQEAALVEVEKEAKKIGFVFGQTAQSTGELKEELKAAQSEAVKAAAVFGKDSDEFAAAAAKAGLLKDEMNDVKTAIKEASTDSGLSKFKNQLGGVFDSLASLDFKEAAERAKSLGVTAKSLNFSELIGGAKSAAIALYEMAAAFLATPFGIVATGVLAVVGGLYALSKASDEAAKKQNQNIQDMVDSYSRLYDGVIRLQQSANKDTDALELQKLKFQRKGIDMQIGNLMILSKYNNGLNDEQLKQLEELRIAQLKNTFDVSDIKIKASQKQTEESQKELEKNLKIIKDYATQRAAQDKKDLEDYKKLQEEKAKANAALLAQIKQNNVELITDDEARAKAQEVLNNQKAINDIVKSKADNDVKFKALESQQLIFEQNIRKIEDDFAARRKAAFDKRVEDQIKADQPRIDAAIKAEEEMEKAASDSIDRQFEKVLKRDADEIKAAEEKAAAINRIEQAAAAATSELVGNVFEIKNNQRQAEIDGIEANANKQIELYQKEADRGIISQEDLTANVNRINDEADKRENEIKKKQFESGKRLALINVAIKTAQGVMTAFNAATPYEVAAYAALALVTGATEAAVINSQKPQFDEGGKVVSGQRVSKSHGRSMFKGRDSLLAHIKEGEVMLNKRQQQLLGGDETFRNIGVPGFADGGLVARSVSAPVENRQDITEQVRVAVSQMPQPVVLVEDILFKAAENAKVKSRAEV